MTKIVSPWRQAGAWRPSRGETGVGMSVQDLRKERAVRRIWESVTATVASGLILWFVTSSLSQSARTAERMAMTVVPAVAPAAAPSGLALPAPATSPSPAAPASLDPPLPVPVAAPPLAVPTPAALPLALPPPKESLLPYSIPLGAVLL